MLITQLDHEANRGPWLSLRERGVEFIGAQKLRDPGGRGKHHFAPEAAREWDGIEIRHRAEAAGENRFNRCGRRLQFLIAHADAE